jgi:hypothetical protein
VSRIIANIDFPTIDWVALPCKVTVLLTTKAFLTLAPIDSGSPMLRVFVYHFVKTLLAAPPVLYEFPILQVTIFHVGSQRNSDTLNMIKKNIDVECIFISIFPLLKWLHNQNSIL